MKVRANVHLLLSACVMLLATAPAIQAYEVDLDGDGTISAAEQREYVVVTNASVESDAGPMG